MTAAAGCNSAHRSGLLRINSQLQQPLVHYQHHIMQKGVSVKQYQASYSCA